MLVTVTDQGVPEHISVIQGLGDGLTNQAVDAVRSWHFKPAMGTDGKPFAMRVPMQMTFRLN
jgi:TonB family protein